MYSYTLSRGFYNVFFSCVFFTMTHTSAPAVTTMQSDVACRECGTIEKSGKLNCCARGGSWFGKCGSTANANVGHTWYEGVQACKARQFQAVLGQQQQQFNASQLQSRDYYDNTSGSSNVGQLYFPQPNANVSFDNAGVDMSSKADVVTTRIISPMLVTPISSTTLIITPGSTSVITSVQKSLAHDTNTAVYKAVAAPLTPSRHIPLNMSTSQANMPIVNRTINLQSHPPIIESMHGDTFIVRSSHSSTSTSVTVRQCRRTLYVMIYTCIILTISGLY